MAKYVNSDGLTYYNNKIKALLNGKSNTNHTHNYAGSSSAGGSANSVANSLSIQLNGGSATTYNGSAAKSINITASSVGAAASSHTHDRIYQMGSDSVTTTGTDTVTNWKNVSNSIHFFTKTGELIDQKSQYGFVFNITNGTSDVHQLWMTQSSGDMAHRGGNASGWNGTWRTILDSSNYKSYALPLSGGTITGDTIVSGSAKVLGCSNGARIRVYKDSNQDPAYAYNNYSEAFFSAYSQKQFSMVMAIPAVTSTASDVGVFGIHQRFGALYVGYLKNGGTNDDRKYFKLIDTDGNSSFLSNSVATSDSVCTSNYNSSGAGWNNYLISGKALSFWNGAFYNTSSNLTYCVKGAFGTGAVRNISGNISVGTAAPSGTATNGDIYIQYA